MAQGEAMVRRVYREQDLGTPVYALEMWRKEQEQEDEEEVKMGEGEMESEIL